jgi:hypothetical protein
MRKRKPASQLGMDSNVTRRDFLNGVGITVGASLLGADPFLLETSGSPMLLSHRKRTPTTTRLQKPACVAVTWARLKSRPALLQIFRPESLQVDELLQRGTFFEFRAANRLLLGYGGTQFDRGAGTLQRGSHWTSQGNRYRRQGNVRCRQTRSGSRSSFDTRSGHSNSYRGSRTQRSAPP